MIACVVLVIVILVLIDRVTKRRGKRPKKSFKKTFFSTSGMNQSTRFTEQGFNEIDEQESYESKDEKLNQEFRSFLNNNIAGRSESMASDDNSLTLNKHNNNLPFAQIDLFSNSPSKFTYSPEQLNEAKSSSATINNKLFDSTYQNMLDKQFSSKQTQKMKFNLKSKFERNTVGVSVKTKPSFKGGKKRKIHCKNYLPNALLPFDHNCKDNRYEELLGKQKNSNKQEETLFTD